MAGTAIALISDPSGGSRSYRDFVCLEMAGTAITFNVGTLSHLILPEVPKISIQRLYLYIHSFLLPDWPF